MDAGSFVIALLTAAGAAAGPAALGTLPDATAPTARCIAAPGEERSGADELAERRADTDVGRDTGQQDAGTTSAPLAEELAQELADVVADSDDPTSRRLAAALAAAGFEATATAGSSQQTAASRADDGMLDDRSSGSDREPLGDDRMGDGRLGDDELDRNRMGTDDQVDRDQRGADRLDRNQDEDVLDCADRGRQRPTGVEDEEPAASDANRSSDLEDVLSSRGSARSSRSSAPVERGGSGIAAALERGERTAG
jgi:hypothetical protein